MRTEKKLTMSKKGGEWGSGVDSSLGALEKKKTDRFGD